MSARDSEDKPTGTTGVRMGKVIGSKITLRTQNFDTHADIQYGRDNVIDVDASNSPEWEESRRRAKDNLFKTLIVGIAIALAASGIAYALGWT